jgi:myo-inositol 2-dehydrogenase/D-chiro-inositol 1-dehydrogenase
LEAAKQALKGVENNVSFFSNHRDMLARTSADVIIISSPNHTHYDIAVDVFHCGLSCMIEKPLCTTIDDCKKLIELENLTATAGRAIWLGLEYRFLAPTSCVLEWDCWYC